MENNFMFQEIPTQTPGPVEEPSAAPVEEKREQHSYTNEELAAMQAGTLPVFVPFVRTMIEGGNDTDVRLALLTVTEMVNILGINPLFLNKAFQLAHKSVEKDILQPLEQEMKDQNQG
jgi:hypothetical protein